MDIKIVSSDGKQQNPLAIAPSVESSTGSQPDELYQREVGKVLGLQNESDFNKYQPNLKTLVDYAKSQTTDHSPENLKWIIRSLEVKLGSPPFAEDRVKFITRYAWLLSEELRINKEKKQFERL